MKPRALILTGFGINCDYETESAFRLAGADTLRIHLNDVIEDKSKLENFQIMAIPGGFSFGDDIASGKVFANKLKYSLEAELKQFIESGKLIIGICNGFQVMVKAGILPFSEKSFVQETTLTFNDSGKFEDRWVYLKANPKSPCIFTKGIERMYLPVRHGEGKFVASSEAIQKLNEKNQVALHYVNAQGEPDGYPWNPNGAMENIAGICDPSGRIFGLMPHPEGYLNKTNHPRWTRGEQAPSIGRKVFENAVGWVARNF